MLGYWVVKIVFANMVFVRVLTKDLVLNILIGPLLSLQVVIMSSVY